MYRYSFLISILKLVKISNQILLMAQAFSIYRTRLGNVACNPLSTLEKQHNIIVVDLLLQSYNVQPKNASIRPEQYYKRNLLNHYLSVSDLGPVNIHAKQIMVHTKLSLDMKLRSSFS